MAGLPDIDKELVIRAKQNDEQAIAQIINQIDSRCYSIVYKCLKGNKRYVSDIEDIVQDSYKEAFTSLDKLKNNNFAPWMYQILKNNIVDFQRSSYAKNKPSNFSEYDNDSFNESFVDSFENDNRTFEPEASVDYSVLQQGMRDVMEQLPDNQRTAIYLRYIEQVKVSEIAEMYEVSENTVKGWLNYGRKAMKEIIEKLQKENKAFFGISALPFFVWTASKEVARATPVQASEIAHVIVANKVPGTTSATSATSTSTPMKIFLATTKGKVVAGIAATAIATGVGAGAYYVYETSQEEIVEETVKEDTSPDKDSDKTSDKDNANKKKKQEDSNKDSQQDSDDSSSNGTQPATVEEDIAVEVDGGTEEVYEDQTVDFYYVDDSSQTSTTTVNEGLQQQDATNDFLDAGDSTN